MAVVNVGRLVSTLDLETGKFNSSVNQSAEMLNSMGARMNRTLGTVEKSFSSLDKKFDVTKRNLLRLSAQYVTFNFVTSAIDAGDNLNDLSKQTGVTVEMLSSLSLAAAQSGTSIADVASSINKMQKNLSEGSDAFSQIGLSISELRKLSPEEQFLAIADQISKLGDDADRTRALMDIFGKSGASLAPLFADGADGIRQAIERAKELGIVLSPEEAAKMDLYNDRIAELTAKLRSLAQDGFMYAYDAALKYNELIGKFTGNYDRLGKDALLDQRTGVNGMIQSLEAQKKELLNNNASARTDFIDIQLNDLTKKQRDLNNRIAEFEKEPVTSTTPPLKLTIKPTGGKTSLSDAQKDLNARQKEANKIYDETRTAAERYAKAVDDLDKALADNLITEDTYTRAIEKVGKEYENALDKNDELADAAKDLGLSFSSAFEDAVVKGEKLSKVLSSLAQDIARLALRKGVTEPLVNFFTNSIGNVFGGLRANGGDVFAGMSYDVGEFGRERFIPSTNGTIVPYDQIGGGGSQLNITNQFNFSGSAAKDYNPAMLDTIKKVAEDSVKAAFAEETRNQMRTGGLFNPV